MIPKMIEAGQWMVAKPVIRSWCISRSEFGNVPFQILSKSFKMSFSLLPMSIISGKICINRDQSMLTSRVPRAQHKTMLLWQERISSGWTALTAVGATSSGSTRWSENMPRTLGPDHTLNEDRTYQGVGSLLSTIFHIFPLKSITWAIVCYCLGLCVKSLEDLWTID